MSITKSYNKHTNTYYAYDTSYIWDDKLQKKIQKKTCIGKFDPETGEIIPTARRGRPSGKPGIAENNNTLSANDIPVAGINPDTIKQEILLPMQQLEHSVSELAKDFETLKRKISMFFGT